MRGWPKVCRPPSLHAAVSSVAHPRRRAARRDGEWGEEIVAVTIFFNEASEISDLGLDRQPPLPPDLAAGYHSEVVFQLPLEGLWLVSWRSDTALENYHVVVPDQRHAYEIVVWKDGDTHAWDALGQRELLSLRAACARTGRRNRLHGGR